MKDAGRSLPFVSTVFALVAVASTGCVGAIERGPGTGAASSGGAGGATAGGSPGTPPGTTPGTAPSTSPGTPADPNAAGILPLRRLTIREYNNTVHDLLGDTSAPGNQLPSDRDETFAFRRAGAIAVQDATLLRTAAESLAATAVHNLGALLPCDPATAGEAACAKQFVDGFGLRAFRRPLTATESAHLVALYNDARNTLKLGFADAIGVLVEAMLQAPAFLYHWEANGPATPEGSVLRLGPYQIASRLSYFLWGSMPDHDLFQAAAAGQLATAAQVEAQARRLLADARARDTVAAFFAEWLGIDDLAEKAPKDAKVYPQYDDALRQAMTGETRAFVQNVVFDGDGRFDTLLGAGFSFVNQGLAGVYGLPPMTGTDLRRADLDPAQRAGFLTEAAFLSLTGASDGSHPVRRGKAVHEKVLCRDLPPPPANVPPAKPASAGGTTRARFTEHDTNTCAAACHSLIDPIGFAFEHYDGIGRYRTTDNGQPVDASGSITLDGTAHDFADAVALTKLLAGSAEARRCFTTQWVRFALARADSDADRASIDGAAAAFAPTAGVRDLLVGVATMRSFRYRSPSPGEVMP